MTEPNRITIYRNGRFTMEDAPAWWSEETQKLWGRYGCDTQIGNEWAAHAQVHRFPGGKRGHAVCMSVGEYDCIDVWTPSEADYLDLLTTRMPAFLSLTNKRAVSESLDVLTNAVVAYARHGQGKHIDRADSVSAKDEQADAVANRLAEASRAAKRATAARVPADAKAGGT